MIAAGVPPSNAFEFVVSPTMEDWRGVVTTQRQGVSELKRAVKKAQKLVGSSNPNPNPNPNPGAGTTMCCVLASSALGRRN